MKTGEDFSVPLCDRAIDILRTLEAKRGKNPYVFPGRPNAPAVEHGAGMLLRRMGVDVTIHGFRTSLQDVGSDVAHVEFEVAELCLSHRIGIGGVARLQSHQHAGARRPMHDRLGRYSSPAPTPTTWWRSSGARRDPDRHHPRRRGTTRPFGSGSMTGRPSSQGVLRS